MLKIDLHIHSIHSGHAYATFYEILEYANTKKMKMIAITDHGQSLIGGPPLAHFKQANRAPKQYRGVKVLWGCEANIIDGNGTIDIDDNALKRIDLLLVGLHLGTSYKDLGKKGNTMAIINCFRKYPVHVFAHPGTVYFDFDLETVFQAACDENILLELNLSSLVRMNSKHYRENLEYYKRMMDVARKNNKKIIVNSDAHFLHEIGDDSILKKYWKELKLTKEIIINNYPEELEKFLKSKPLK